MSNCKLIVEKFVFYLYIMVISSGLFIRGYKESLAYCIICWVMGESICINVFELIWDLSVYFIYIL